MGLQQEDREVQQYVASFKASSDRARYAFYLVIAVTVLLTIANYNFQSWSWPIRRVQAWYEATEESTNEAFLGGDFEKVKTAREEYLKQLTSRSVFSSSPLPGVSIDYNDLGIIGGITLVLFMAILTTCLSREHDNLYLSLFKVRQLADSEGGGDGESKANLLYHALAMTQTLSSPPTLARWNKRSFFLGHYGILYFLPAVAFLWLIYTNIQTLWIGLAYGANMFTIIISQLVIELFLLIFGVAAFLHSRAMAMRWKKTFFAINPTKRKLPVMSVVDWLKLPYWPRSNYDRPKRVKFSLLNDRVQLEDRQREVKEVEATIPLPKRRVTKTSLRQMIKLLLDDWEPDSDLELEVAENRIGADWSVSGSLTRTKKEKEE